MGYRKWFVERVDAKRANDIGALYEQGNTDIGLYLAGLGMPKYVRRCEVFKWLSWKCHIGQDHILHGACAIMSQVTERGTHTPSGYRVRQSVAQLPLVTKAIESWQDFRNQNS